jgi:hypothetical protein
MSSVAHDADPTELPQPSQASLGTTTPTLVQPAIVGGLALMSCALVAVRDPNVSGSYGYCPFKAVTGLDCPGCGMMRGMHSLLRGHPGQALNHNILLPLVLILAVFAYVRWVLRTLGHEVRPIDPPRWLMYVSVAGVLAFWVVRNLGGPFTYLDSNA